VRLHILQGGIGNDKARLRRAAKDGSRVKGWIAPKRAEVGDDAIIYVGDEGLFATGRVASAPMPRPDWPNRYGADLDTIRLLAPPVSLPILRLRLPELEWTRYPRSITTPTAAVADRLRALIHLRRATGGFDIDESTIEHAGVAELRALAYGAARSSAPVGTRRVTYRVRLDTIRRYVLARANGFCEACGCPAPFRLPRGSPYLEPHHIGQLSEDGADDPRVVLAVCPNCHRRAHLSHDARRFKITLLKRVRQIERGLGAPPRLRAIGEPS
jgi:hypothetical protein